MLIVVGRGEGLFKMNIKNDFYFVVYCNYMFFSLSIYHFFLWWRYCTYVLMYGYFTRTGAQKAILQVQLVKKALVCKQRIFFLP